MKTLILAGGKGTRLPVSAGDKPKSLVDVASKTILDRQIEWLLEHNLSDIRLALGFRAEQIINHIKNTPFYKNLNIDYVIEPAPLGTGGAIKFAAKGLEDDFLVLNGDILTNINLIQFIESYKIVPRGTFLGEIMAWKCPDCRDFGLIQTEKQQKHHKITAFLEKQDKIKEGHINAGVYILSPKVFDFVKKDVFSIEKDLFPALAAQNKLFAYIYSGYWSDLGTEGRLEEARKRFVGV